MSRPSDDCRAARELLLLRESRYESIGESASASKVNACILRQRLERTLRPRARSLAERERQRKSGESFDRRISAMASALSRCGERKDVE